MSLYLFNAVLCEYQALFAYTFNEWQYRSEEVGRCLEYQDKLQEKSQNTHNFRMKFDSQNWKLIYMYIHCFNT